MYSFEDKLGNFSIYLSFGLEIIWYSLLFIAVLITQKV